jgi:hypothetical protein
MARGLREWGVDDGVFDDDRIRHGYFRVMTIGACSLYGAVEPMGWEK